MFYSNYGSISCRFWDIQCRKISRPWNPSQEPIKVIACSIIRQTVYGFLLVFYSNFVPKTHHFWDIRLQKCRDLENRLRGSSFDRAHKTSYWRFIVNMAISLVVSEIFNVENIAILKSRSGVNRGHWKWYHSIHRIWFPIIPILFL